MILFKSKAAAAFSSAIALATLVAATPTQTTARDESELNCLALNIYFESRGASRVDREAVGHVTVNRSESRHFPSTICGVVYQKHNGRGQFSWTTDGNSDIPREARAWQDSRNLAREILGDAIEDPSRGATYFYNHNRARPSWANRFEVTLRTNGHTYLRRG